MRKFVLASALFALCSFGGIAAPEASAQKAILSETFGRGVHAYYAGNYQQAYDDLSSAIDGGLKDPLAYYFRGMAAHKAGHSPQAEVDWEAGAELEAEGKIGLPIGRALSRFQGNDRLKLEEIRRNVKLRYLAKMNEQDAAKYGKAAAAEANVLRSPAPPKAGAVTPPPAPPVAAPKDDPFAENAAGEPKVESDDSLKDAMSDPFGDEAGAAPMGDEAPPADTSTDPFGGTDTAPADDPFGGTDAAPADDPFGGSDAPPADDPLGADDPFN
jgi:hypothetical protein